MNKYDKLKDEATKEGIDIQVAPLPQKILGLYYSESCIPPLIALNESMQTQAEQCCVLAEELGHHYTSYGNLLTDPTVNNTIIRQQEVRAKRWAVKKLVSLINIINAFESGANSIHEMAEYLEVTEEFLLNAFSTYQQMYGKYKQKGKYIVYFDPPGVYKNI